MIRLQKHYDRFLKLIMVAWKWRYGAFYAGFLSGRIMTHQADIIELKKMNVYLM
jgi:hypothetical protein